MSTTESSQSEHCAFDGPRQASDTQAKMWEVFLHTLACQYCSGCRTGSRPERVQPLVSPSAWPPLATPLPSWKTSGVLLGDGPGNSSWLQVAVRLTVIGSCWLLAVGRWQLLAVAVRRWRLLAFPIGRSLAVGHCKRDGLSHSPSPSPRPLLSAASAHALGARRKTPAHNALAFAQTIGTVAVVAAAGEMIYVIVVGVVVVVAAAVVVYVVVVVVVVVVVAVVAVVGWLAGWLVGWLVVLCSALSWLLLFSSPSLLQLRLRLPRPSLTNTANRMAMAARSNTTLSAMQPPAR